MLWPQLKICYNGISKVYLQNGLYSHKRIPKSKEKDLRVNTFHVMEQVNLILGKPDYNSDKYDRDYRKQIDDHGENQQQKQTASPRRFRSIRHYFFNFTLSETVLVRIVDFFLRFFNFAESVFGFGALQFFNQICICIVQFGLLTFLRRS